MIISIASGKGGTGKTTVAAGLAASVDPPVTVLDCDVEEPNLHLFLHPAVTHSEKVIAPVPEIDPDRCTLCRKCMEICRFNAIAVAGKTVVTFAELCHSCGGCSIICPEKAITKKERVLGLVETGTCSVPGLAFGQGLLDIGQVMVPPVVRRVKTHGAGPGGLTLIDAPPGTSCPVIAAMKDTDFVVLVTEPTPFGLNDLKLAVETVRLLGIPHGLIINRAGMGDDAVYDYAREKNLRVLMEIPFDRKIATAYSKGDLIISARPHYKEKFKQLYNDICRLADDNTGAK
ncbi:MAG: ATP-binding protein [Desulfotignum sp.]|nr:ATP-binding protein [Desulfotignum sp.]MCF8112748.1 ATP-binding protein [Desulfotignum sp.]